MGLLNTWLILQPHNIVVIMCQSAMISTYAHTLLSPSCPSHIVYVSSKVLTLVVIFPEVIPPKPPSCNSLDLGKRAIWSLSLLWGIKCLTLFVNTIWIFFFPTKKEPEVEEWKGVGASYSCGIKPVNTSSASLQEIRSSTLLTLKAPSALEEDKQSASQCPLSDALSYIQIHTHFTLTLFSCVFPPPLPSSFLLPSVNLDS